MNYRKIGPRVAEEISAIGFGCMRLPLIGDTKEIDRKQANAMFEHALTSGVNYFDTAWPYHDGESEIVLGEFLARGYRDKVFLATKLPIWQVKEVSDLDSIFSRQLEKLQTDHIDFYLLHALSAARWPIVADLDIIGWAEKKKAEGKIRYLGFSFHDNHRAFTDIVDGYNNWDFCQIQYNYMNELVQAGTAGLAYAASKGIGVVVMEPLLGGVLASPLESVSTVFAESAEKRMQSPVEQAFRWLWDKQEVGTVLSGMSSMEQLVENIEYAGRSAVGCIAESDRVLFRKAKEIYEELRPVACTECRYCMPCPHGVDIPRNFQILNQMHMFRNEQYASYTYNTAMDEKHRASECIACGECEPKCPQQIPIIDSLQRVRSELEKKPDPA